MKNFDVIVCGSLHLDIVVQSPDLPRIDETVVGSAWKQVCGGKGGNQAMQAAKAGAKTAMISRVGKDGFADVLMQNLGANDVNTSAVTVDAVAGSGMSVAILKDDGDYGAVIVSGSNLKIDSSTLAAEWNKLGGGRVLILQNEVSHAVNVAAAAAAKAAGARVIYNAAPVRKVSDDLLSLVDVLVVNRIEAEGIAGHAVEDRGAAVAAMPALQKLVKSVVITLGGEGLVVSDGSVPVEIEAQRVKVISTHGAGDCFVGTLAHRLSQGASLVEACHAANLRAAEFVSGH
jgi:ribokinase